MSKDFRIGDGSPETQREIFLDAAVEFLYERDIRRPIADVELKRIAAELGYKHFDQALSLFAVGLAKQPLQNMRFAVQLTFATVAPTSTANLLHSVHLWTPAQILDQSVRICKAERIVGPLSHSQVHMLFTLGQLPSASTINQKFDSGKGWGFYEYQLQLSSRLKSERMAVRDVPVPRGMARMGIAQPVQRQKTVGPRWDRNSVIRATVAYMTKIGTDVLPSKTEINIAARRSEMPTTQTIDKLFAKSTGDDGMVHFRAYVDTVIGPTLDKRNTNLESPARGLAMTPPGSTLT